MCRNGAEVLRKMVNTVCMHRKGIFHLKKIMEVKVLFVCGFRGGLELLELKKGQTVKTFIPKVAEGVFTIICLFNKTDEYVLYYHSGKKTLRVFR